MLYANLFLVRNMAFKAMVPDNKLHSAISIPGETSGDTCLHEKYAR